MELRGASCVGVGMLLERVRGASLALMVAACGARELPVQSQEAVLPAAQTSAAAPTVSPSASATAPPTSDEGDEAARANVAKGDVELDAATRDPSRIANAKPYYEAALSPVGNRVYGYAAYKLAFVYWNLNDFETSLYMFTKAIDFGAAHPDVQGATAIHDAALRDVVPVYAVQGKPDKAFAFFRMLGGDDAHALRMLEALGQTYDDTGKYPDAKRIYAELKQRDPGHSCRWGVLDRYASPTANRATLNADLARCPP